MEISPVLRAAALALLSSGRGLARQSFPPHPGIGPGFRSRILRPTGPTPENGVVRSANVGPSGCPVALPVADTANGFRNNTTHDFWTDRLRNWRNAHA